MIGGLSIDLMPVGSVVVRFDAEGGEVRSNVMTVQDPARDLLLGADG